MTAQLIVGAVLAIAGLYTLDRLRKHEELDWLIVLIASGLFITFGLSMVGSSL